MKLQILLAFILVASIFGGAVALAKDGSDRATELERVNPTYVREAVTAKQVTEVTQVGVQPADIESIDSSDLAVIAGTKYRRATFPTSHVLAGGLDNSNKGFLASVGLLSVALVKGEGNDTNMTLKIAAGRLQLRNSDENTKYKLIASGDKVNDGTFEFYVLPKETELGNLDDASSKSIGTFKLERAVNFAGYSRWKGTLKLNSGNDVGEYEGTFYATGSKSIRPATKAEKEKEVEDGVGLDSTTKNGNTRPMPAEQVVPNSELSKQEQKSWREFFKGLFSKRESKESS